MDKIEIANDYSQTFRDVSDSLCAEKEAELMEWQIVDAIINSGIPFQLDLAECYAMMPELLQLAPESERSKAYRLLEIICENVVAETIDAVVRYAAQAICVADLVPEERL